MRVCATDGFAPHSKCTRIREEWFTHANLPRQPDTETALRATARIRQPGPGLRLAIDPRLPRIAQRFRFALSTAPPHGTVQWFLDGEVIDQCTGSDCLWTLRAGTHTLFARIRDRAAAPEDEFTPAPIEQTANVSFSVY